MFIDPKIEKKIDDLIAQMTLGGKDWPNLSGRSLTGRRF